MSEANPLPIFPRNKNLNRISTSGSVGSGGYGTLFCLPRLIKIFGQNLLETKKKVFFSPLQLFFIVKYFLETKK